MVCLLVPADIGFVGKTNTGLGINGFEREGKLRGTCHLALGLGLFLGKKTGFCVGWVGCRGIDQQLTA